MERRDVFVVGNYPTHAIVWHIAECPDEWATADDWAQRLGMPAQDGSILFVWCDLFKTVGHARESAKEAASLALECGNGPVVTFGLSSGALVDGWETV